MKCKNVYCLYQQDGECVDGKIEIDEEGRCRYCHPIKPTMEQVRKVKESAKDELNAIKQSRYR